MVRISEAEFQQQVLDLADLFGWLAFHPYDSRRSRAGWPDLALCRPPRLLLAELKAEGGRLRKEQRRWILALQNCPGVETYIWYPSDLEGIMHILR